MSEAGATPLGEPLYLFWALKALKISARATESEPMKPLAPGHPPVKVMVYVSASMCVVTDGVFYDVKMRGRSFCFRGVERIRSAGGKMAFADCVAAV